jgi:hypothetical protein
MVRSVKPLVCAAGILGLTVCGFAEPAGQDAKAKAAKAAVEARIQEYEMEFGPGFRQAYRAELHFMRVVARPTREQYERIAADGDAVVKAVIRKFVETAAMTPNRGAGQPEPRALLTDAVVERVRNTLSPEQAERYQKELDGRAAARRQDMRIVLVARIDKLLLLTPEQRDKLGDILDKNWDRSWDQAQWLRYADEYPIFPPMPDAKILPILTDTQQAVWRGTRKQHIQFGMDFEIGLGIPIEDEVWDGPPKAGPKPAEDKAAGADKGVSKAGGRR